MSERAMGSTSARSALGRAPLWVIPDGLPLVFRFGMHIRMLRPGISVFDQAISLCFHLTDLEFVEKRRRGSPIDKAKRVAALVAEAKRLDCAQTVCDPIPRELTFSGRRTSACSGARAAGLRLLPLTPSRAPADA